MSDEYLDAAERAFGAVKPENRLPPELVPDLAQISIAISLQRIADALERQQADQDAQRCMRCGLMPSASIHIPGFEVVGGHDYVSPTQKHPLSEMESTPAWQGLPPVIVSNPSTPEDFRPTDLITPECCWCGMRPSAPVHDEKYGAHAFCAEKSYGGTD